MKDSGNETHFNQNQKDSFNVPHSFSGDKFCFSDNSGEEVPINCPEIDEDMKATDPELTDFPLSPDLKPCMITKTVFRTAVEGKCQLGVSSLLGRGIHTGIAEVRGYLTN